MLISREKRRSNIVEYLLYMYQIEDIIRSFQFDITQIDANVVQRFDQPAAIKLEIKLWYADLIDKMQQQQLQLISSSTQLQQMLKIRCSLRSQIQTNLSIRTTR